VITKVLHGYRPAGLLRYLFGPGKHEEHRNPRVVASWDAAPWLHHPAKLPPVQRDGEVVELGEFGFDLRPLTTTMQETAEATGLPVTNPQAITKEWADRVRAGDLPKDTPGWVKHYKYDRNKDAVVLRQGYVWHCPVRLHPSDRTLTDQEWETIAERLMRATGIHQAGCRWIAVRHADDHIHLVATLVSENTGKRFYPYRDWQKLEKERRQLERELGLYETAGADRTARREPTRAEKGKAQRLGWPVTAREELRRVVAQYAATTQDGDEFLAQLKREGLNPKTATSADGQVRGYTVALPGDLTAKSEPVRYSGTTLAADLTWPKLAARWATTPPPAPTAHTEDGRTTPAARHESLHHAADVAERAIKAIRDGSEDVDGIAHATSELLATLAHGREGREQGPLAEITDRYDRAARTPHRVLPQHIGPIARDLRQASRQIAAAGALTRRGKEKFGMLALVLALASLVAEIAAWHHAGCRTHQATAARRAAMALDELPRPAPKARPPGHPTQPPVRARRERPAVWRGINGLPEPPSRGRRGG
jgi:hypothetical protein